MRSHNSKGSEGLYNSRQLSFQRRQADQEEINKFIDQIFASKNLITLKDYQQINLDVSSEMFCSLMRVLHDHLPCTTNFFI